MRSTGYSRWRGLALMIAVGTVCTAALGPVYGWGAAIPIAVIAVIAIGAGVFNYLLAGRDSDRGALARGRLDERQLLLRWQAWSFSARVMFAASAIGALVAAVLRYPVWPFSLFIAFQVISFYAGLVYYRGRGGSFSTKIQQLFIPNEQLLLPFSKVT